MVGVHWGASFIAFFVEWGFSHKVWLVAVFCRLICEQDVIHGNVYCCVWIFLIRLKLATIVAKFISAKLFLIATSGELALKWFLNKTHFRSYFNENTARYKLFFIIINNFGKSLLQLYHVLKLALSRAITFYLTTHENASFLACAEVVSLTCSSNVQSFLTFTVLLSKQSEIIQSVAP